MFIHPTTPPSICCLEFNCVKKGDAGGRLVCACMCVFDLVWGAVCSSASVKIFTKNNQRLVVHFGLALDWTTASFAY